MLSLKKYKVSTSGERCWDNSGSPATFPSLFLPDFHPSASIPTNRSFPVSVLPCSKWTARVALASPAVDVDTVKMYLVIASGICRRTLFFDPTSGNRLVALAAEHVESRFSGTRAGPVLTTVLLRSKLVGGPHRVLALRSLTTAAIPHQKQKDAGIPQIIPLSREPGMYQHLGLSSAPLGCCAGCPCPCPWWS